MSEKVTFQELVDSIASETANTKQFTHDFFKDFVSVINSGLEENGSVNIAGFGKFELREMDERDGYNPQTGDKITIPAHNKVVFKPYKDLRELVNAPYEHLESEILDDEEADDEQKKPDIFFTPSTPIPDNKELNNPEKPFSDEGPFGFGNPGAKDSDDNSNKSGDEDETQNAGDDDDIVEFTPDIEAENPSEKKEIFPFFIENMEKKEEKSTVEESGDRKEGKDPIHEIEETESKIIFEHEQEKEVTGTEKEEEKSGYEIKQDHIITHSEANTDSGEDEPVPRKEQPISIPSSARQIESEQRSSKISMWMIAAAVIILIIAASAWYLTTSEYNRPSYTAATPSVRPGSTGQAPKNNPAGNNQHSQKDPATSSAASSRQKPNNASSKQQTTTQQRPTKSIVIAKGQTLWSLAHSQYDDPYLWPWIYTENQASIDNPNLIIAGQPLDIPLPRGSNNGLTPDDSLQVALSYVETYAWYKTSGSGRAKYYLYAAKMYNKNVLEYTDIEIDQSDLIFANHVR